MLVMMLKLTIDRCETTDLS